MAAVRYLGFLKFKFFNGWDGKELILHHQTKFRKDRSNRCREIVIFVIFKMAAAAILDFQKIEILAVSAVRASMRHRAKFNQNQSNGCRDMGWWISKHKIVANLLPSPSVKKV